ncbi:tripartite motif containing 13-like [Rhynochetos jubatus]
METLRQMLVCPVCLELFTPPVLVLPCAHSFCKQCLETILLRENCHHANRFFHYPVCRKVIYLRGRGIVGLLRNNLVESILEKFKYELENICTQERRQLSETCEEHGENMNLMCLTDDEPICAICKLFGKHKDHKAAKVSEAYSERKKAFTKKLHLICKKYEEATSDSLHHDYSTKLEKLQAVSNEAKASGQLYQQMKTLLEQHENSVQFLQGDKKLKQTIEKVLEGKASYQDPQEHKISVPQYFEEHIKGINIKDYLSTTCKVMLPIKPACEKQHGSGWKGNSARREGIQSPEVR